MKEQKNNPKTGSRLLAIQSYYSMLMDAGQTKENAISSAAEILKKEDIEFRKNFAEELLNFTVTEKDGIETIAKKYLDKNETLETMTPLLLAILMTAIAELLKDSKTERAIIISEYLLITSEFFGRGETGFVHAVMDKFVKGDAVAS